MAHKERIGIVGAGRMGANIARRLHDVGYTIAAVYDVRPDVESAVATEVGAEPASSLARTTELSDVIITVVTDDNAMRTIFAQTGDSLLTGANGRLFINCATVSPAV